MSATTHPRDAGPLSTTPPPRPPPPLYVQLERQGPQVSPSPTSVLAPSAACCQSDYLQMGCLVKTADSSQQHYLPAGLTRRASCAKPPSLAHRFGKGGNPPASVTKRGGLDQCFQSCGCCGVHFGLDDKCSAVSRIIVHAAIRSAVCPASARLSRM